MGVAGKQRIKRHFGRFEVQATEPITQGHISLRHRVPKVIKETPEVAWGAQEANQVKGDAKFLPNGFTSMTS